MPTYPRERALTELWLSNWKTAFHCPRGNAWLNLAILWEVLLLVVVVVVPVFHGSFGGFSLTGPDWVTALCVAASVVRVLEAGKWVLARRRGSREE
jgi:P-type Ca2+ transporter type 2C